MVQQFLDALASNVEVGWLLEFVSVPVLSPQERAMNKCMHISIIQYMHTYARTHTHTGASLTKPLCVPGPAKRAARKHRFYSWTAPPPP
jgi:hypothetical protein